LWLSSLLWREDGESASGSRQRLEILVVRLLWCSKKKKFVMEREKLVMVVPIAGEEMGLQGCLVMTWGEVVVAEEVEVVVVKETRERLATKTNWGRLIFLSTLDPDFFFLKAWNPPIFIEGGKGIFFLYWFQILTLDLNWKDLNRWFKVCHHELSNFNNSRLPKLASKPLWCQLAKNNYIRV
jgi:hypothetical protein